MFQDNGMTSVATTVGVVRWLFLLAAPMLLAALATTARAGSENVLHDGPDGVTCDHYNYGALVPWRHRQGDWRDAAGAAQGQRPFVQAGARAGGGGVMRFDVTALVRDWLAGKSANDGFLIGGLASGGTGAAVFHSRESPDPSLRPRLVVATSGGEERLPAVADATLDCSTFTSLGTRPTMTASRDRRVAIQFDVARLKGESIRSAILELSTSRTYDDVVLGIFALHSPLSPASARAGAVTGLAARYKRDRDIAKDPAVVMATGFESSSWRDAWSHVNPRGVMEVVRGGNAVGFERLVDAALRVAIPAGQNLGLDMAYRFKDKVGREPEEIYFRYYLRLASDWRPTVEGGKLPGISGTSKAGWGGRKSDGVSGWSMRGLFGKAPLPGNPLHDSTTIGTYAYHADMKDFWGDPWLWSRDGLGLLERDRWYCLEQYFKLNEPGRKDGVLRAWIDGRLAFEKTDVHVRDLPTMKIEEIWMNVYHGGSAPAPHDMHLFIDNVVIARSYIGPMGE
jgi:hypothetical protein